MFRKKMFEHTCIGFVHQSLDANAIRVPPHTTPKLTPGECRVCNRGTWTALRHLKPDFLQRCRISTKSMHNVVHFGDSSHGYCSTLPTCTRTQEDSERGRPGVGVAGARVAVSRRRGLRTRPTIPLACGGAGTARAYTQIQTHTHGNLLRQLPRSKVRSPVCCL